MKGAREKIIDRTLEAWADEFRKKMLTKKVQKLIRAANYDLYNGPLDKETAKAEGLAPYPGFSSAVKAIHDVLSSTVPSQLYIDIQSEMWSESEPEFETEEDWQFAMESGDIYEIPQRDLVEALVGHELTGYLR